ncbi:MAG: redox-sensitive transcriptional activator SoxR [Proteobacteria bacterium]|nr:redox-sensitive transcriptional activator SoxR [Pseudomonadota bacterium]
MKTAPLIDIGEVARRAGVAVSALRFYEAEGLIESVRPPGQRRRFHRAVLRRVAFIRAAQSVGLTLHEIKSSLALLPSKRTPNKADWERIAAGWAPLLDAKLAELTRLRTALTSCIGCGCLSLRRCALYNPGDAVRANGPGARYLLGDDPRVIMRRGRAD